MKENRYTDLMDHIHSGKNFPQETMEKVQQARRPPTPAAPPRSPRRWLVLVASILLVAAAAELVCLAALWIQPQFSQPEEGYKGIAELGGTSFIEWEGRKYELEWKKPTDPIGPYLGTGELREREISLYSREGQSPLLWVAAPLSEGEENYHFYKFAGFASPDHTILDVIRLYEEACGPLSSVSCVQKPGYESSASPLPHTESQEEIQQIRSSFSQVYPDSNLSTGTESLSSDSSTYSYRIEADGKELVFTFANGVSCSIELYKGNTVGSGFGYLYAIPEYVKDWLSQ